MRGDNRRRLQLFSISRPSPLPPFCQSTGGRGAPFVPFVVLMFSGIYRLCILSALSPRPSRLRLEAHLAIMALQIPITQLPVRSFLMTHGRDTLADNAVDYRLFLHLVLTPGLRYLACYSIR